MLRITCSEWPCCFASVGVRAVKFVDRPARDNSMKQRIDFRMAGLCAIFSGRWRRRRAI
jgi:hypothetical protein